MLHLSVLSLLIFFLLLFKIRISAKNNENFKGAQS